MTDGDIYIYIYTDGYSFWKSSHRRDRKEIGRQGGRTYFGVGLVVAHLVDRALLPLPLDLHPVREGRKEGRKGEREGGRREGEREG